MYRAKDVYLFIDNDNMKKRNEVIMCDGYFDLFEETFEKVCQFIQFAQNI